MVKFLVEWFPNVHVLSCCVESALPVVGSRLCGDSLCLEVDGTEATIMLPHRIPPELLQQQAGDLCPLVKGPDGTYLLRLKLPASEKQVEPLDGSYEYHKWSRKYLNGLTRFSFHCLSCQSVLVSTEENCNRINDMPSEYWAELMDYWHCHKPDHLDPTGEDSLLKGSRYGQLNPSQGEILIGGSYIMMSRATMQDKVEVDTDGQVSCTHCHTPVGHISKDNHNNLRLDKWSITLQTAQNEPVQVFPPEDDITLALINYTRAYSGRHMLLKCQGHRDRLVWIFSLGTDVVHTGNKMLHKALKLLWTEDPDLIAKTSGTHTVEPLEVSPKPYTCFQERCQQTIGTLPASCQRLQQWNVAFVALQ